MTDKTLAHFFRNAVESGTTPAGAGFYIGAAIELAGMTQTSVAKTVGVNPSSISRLADGARLTPEMAANLSKHYDLDIDVMFQLEARCLANIAKSLLESDDE